jgi:hypothetical protein
MVYDVGRMSRTSTVAPPKRIPLAAVTSHVGRARPSQETRCEAVVNIGRSKLPDTCLPLTLFPTDYCYNRMTPSAHGARPIDGAG